MRDPGSWPGRPRTPRRGPGSLGRQRPAASGQRPAASGQRPAASGEERARAAARTSAGAGAGPPGGPDLQAVRTPAAAKIIARCKAAARSSAGEVHIGPSVAVTTRLANRRVARGPLRRRPGPAPPPPEHGSLRARACGVPSDVPVRTDCPWPVAAPGADGSATRGRGDRAVVVSAGPNGLAVRRGHALTAAEETSDGGHARVTPALVP